MTHPYSRYSVLFSNLDFHISCMTWEEVVFEIGKFGPDKLIHIREYHE